MGLLQTDGIIRAEVLWIKGTVASSEGKTTALAPALAEELKHSKSSGAFLGRNLAIVSLLKLQRENEYAFDAQTTLLVRNAQAI